MHQDAQNANLFFLLMQATIQDMLAIYDITDVYGCAHPSDEGW